MSLLLLLSGASREPISVPAHRIDDLFLEVALNGSYHDAVMASAPLGFWLLGEHRLTTPAVDRSGEANDGAYVGGMTFGNRGPYPHGGTAIALNGTTGYVDLGDLVDAEFTEAMSIEFLFKFTSAQPAASLVSKGFGDIPNGWSVTVEDGQIRFTHTTLVGDEIFSVLTPLTYNDGEWHHCICAWDGTTPASGGGSFPLLFGRRMSSSAGKAKVYIDGELVAQAAAVSASPGPGAPAAARLLIGASDQAGSPAEDGFFDGSISGVAIYDSELTPAVVSSHYASLQWTDIGHDAIVRMRLKYGTNSTGPTDRMSNAGTLDFTLDNSEYNQSGTAGLYSPLHEDCLPGFTFDIPVRVRLVRDDVSRIRFWGRIAFIDPEPGVYGSRRTNCIAHDYVHYLNDTDVRSVEPQLDQSETDLLRAVFDALPYDVQPMELDLAEPVDTYEYAFYDLQGGRKATFIISKLMTNAWGRAFVTGDGTFAYRNRLATINQIIDFELDDSEILELESPSDRKAVFDRVRVITHDKDIDASPLSELFVHPGVPFVPAGESLEIWGDYRNPDNDLQTIGGFDMQQPEGGDEFGAFENEDGSGTDITASTTVVADFFASTVKLTLTNNHATLGAYFLPLKTLGRGIYDRAPVTNEAVSGRGVRPITIDMTYQQSSLGQELADLILHEREVITDPVESITINPHHSEKLLLLTLDGEPNMNVAVTETQTGLSGAQGKIRSIEIEIGEGLIMSAVVGLTPSVIGYEWIMGDPNFSVLGETTVLG